jgi:RND superfamily putative drug exporter
MGLAIDYALFVVSRFREELAHRPGTGRSDVNAAVVATMTTAGRTVLFSGVTVAAALASLLLFPQVFLRSMGYGGMAAVLVAMVAALTVLPATLAVLGPKVNALALPRRQATFVGADSGRWGRIAHAVMRRPVVWLVAIVVGLLALGSPILGVHWGSVDYRVLPTDAPSRVAIQRQIDQMGGEHPTAYVVVRGAADVDAYASALQRVPGVLGVQVLDRNVAKSATLLLVTWTGNSQTQDSQRLLRELRAVPPPAGASVVMGGTTAETVDLIHSVGSRLPWMAGFVIVVMLLLLFAAFGSVVLPLKAVVMNAVSIAASFGVVTWIFADGHLAHWLGFTAHGYLDATQPILMLAVLFGLSMDYEVFLLSRVRERWDVSHDNEDAVATGVQHTGKIITSAAILLAVVIGAFSTSSIVFIKMIGVGMLVAVLVDATIVRLLLVPATMRLLGTLNWWAPGPLRRWYERHGIRESDAPGPEPSPLGATVLGRMVPAARSIRRKDTG